MQSWADRQQDILRLKFPGWDIWYVRSIYPRPSSIWCARPKGHPVATLNCSSPEELEGEIERAIERNQNPN